MAALCFGGIEVRKSNVPPTTIRIPAPTSVSIYHTTRWKRKQAKILRRDGYLCQESKRYGIAAEATTVHHIWPVGDYPEYAWEDWNLIALSSEMHNRMHDRVTRQLTALGEWWRERRVPPSPQR